MAKKRDDIVTVRDHVPHGHGKGGMSQNRYQRLADEDTHVYLSRLAEQVKEYFKTHDVEGIAIGGPGMTKNDFIDNYLDPALMAKVQYVVDTPDGGELGIRELKQKMSQDHVFEKNALMQEKRVVSSFIEMIAKDDPLVEYGMKEVAAALGNGQVDQLFLSEALDPQVIDGLADKATATGTTIIMISTASEEGKMFQGGFTGIGAILRWNIVGGE